MNRRLREFFRSWNSQDEDTRNAALLISGISLVIILAIAIVGYGFFTREKDSDTVLIVNNKDIKYDYVQSRLTKFMPAGANMDPSQFSSSLSAILAQIEQEELVRYVGKQQNITVSEEELQAEMNSDLGLAADATKEVYATALRRELLNSNLSLNEYKEVQRAQVIENKLREQGRTSLGEQAEQVNIRLLQVPTKEAADAAQAKLNAGDVLGLVAGSVSTHSSASKGGEVGWVARGSFNSKLEDAMFSQAVGTTSGIIETDEGFYIVEVRARETRAVSDEVRNAVGNRVYSQAILKAREDVGSQIVMTTGQLNRLANHFSSALNAGG